MLAQRSSSNMVMAMAASRRSLFAQAPRRLQSTDSSYTSILVDTVGKNKDVSLITLNRPKAVSPALLCSASCYPE